MDHPVHILVLEADLGEEELGLRLTLLGFRRQGPDVRHRHFDRV
jgi:hypothetical protein